MGGDRGRLARWFVGAGFLLAAGGCKSYEANLPVGDGDGGSGAADAGQRFDGGGGTVADAAPRPDAAPGTQTTVISADDMVDTYVRMTSPTFNYGSTDRICGDATDDRKMLMRIDVSALPVGAQVVAADLHLWSGLGSADHSVQTWSCYQMLESWDEGSADAAAGTASWNDRDADNAWTTAGAGDGSHDNQVVGAFVPDAIDTEYVVALEPSLIQGWLDDEDSNFGIVIIVAGEDGACFDSSEFADQAKRPSLAINWLP